MQDSGGSPRTSAHAEELIDDPKVRSARSNSGKVHACSEHKGSGRVIFSFAEHPSSGPNQPFPKVFRALTRSKGGPRHPHTPRGGKTPAGAPGVTRFIRSNGPFWYPNPCQKPLPRTLASLPRTQASDPVASGASPYPWHPVSPPQPIGICQAGVPCLRHPTLASP